MNMFYHEVEVGFNFWYLIVPLATLLMGAVGTFGYHVVDGNGKIRKRGRWFYYGTRTLAVFVTIGLIILIVTESITGIFQLCLNILALGDDTAWAVFILAGVLICLFGIVLVLMLAGLKIGEMYSLGVLVKAKHLAHKRALRSEEDSDVCDDDGVLLIGNGLSSEAEELLRPEGPTVPDFMFRGLRERNY